MARIRFSTDVRWAGEMLSHLLIRITSAWLICRWAVVSWGPSCCFSSSLSWVVDMGLSSRERRMFLASTNVTIPSR